MAASASVRRGEGTGTVAVTFLLMPQRVSPTKSGPFFREQPGVHPNVSKPTRWGRPLAREIWPGRRKKGTDTVAVTFLLIP